MAYKEVKMGKGDADKIFGDFNSNFVPKGCKDVHKQNKANPSKTGSKKPKIHYGASLWEQQEQAHRKEHKSNPTD